MAGRLIHSIGISFLRGKGQVSREKDVLLLDKSPDPPFSRLGHIVIARERSDRSNPRLDEIGEIASLPAVARNDEIGHLTQSFFKGGRGGI